MRARARAHEAIEADEDVGADDLQPFTCRVDCAPMGFERIGKRARQAVGSQIERLRIGGEDKVRIRENGALRDVRHTGGALAEHCRRRRLQGIGASAEIGFERFSSGAYRLSRRRGRRSSCRRR